MRPARGIFFEREKKGRDWMECMRQRVPVEWQLLFKVEEMRHWRINLGPKDFSSSDRPPDDRGTTRGCGQHEVHG